MYKEKHNLKPLETNMFMVEGVEFYIVNLAEKDKEVEISIKDIKTTKKHLKCK